MTAVFRNAAWLVAILTAATRGQDSNAKLARLAGRVVDAATSQPLKKAAVILRETGSKEPGGLAVFTDESGHFEFTNVLPGDWSAQVERNGYVPLGRLDGTKSKELRWKLEPGSSVDDITIRLIQAGVIAGRVLDSDGEPVVGASVSVSPAGVKKNFPPLPWAQTNDLGEYRLYNLAPDKYIVSATYQAAWRRPGVRLRNNKEGAKREAPREDYVTTYYPGTADSSQAGTVSVAAGAQLSGMDIRLALGEVVRVRGKVEGRPGPLTMLTLVELQGSSRMTPKTYTAVAKPDSTFEFENVRPGSYVLMCVAGMDAGKRQGKQRIEIGSEDVEGIQIMLNPLRKIQGKVRVEGSTPLRAGLHAVLIPRDDDPTHQAGGFSPVDANGSFSFEGVADDRYDLILARIESEPDNFYVKSIRFGDDDALSAGVDVHGPPPGRLEVLLRDDGGTVVCTVRAANGEAAGHAKVTAAPEEPLQQALVLYGEAEADESGHCKLQGLAPGRYLLLAFDDAEGPDLQNSVTRVLRDGMLQRFEKLGQTVDVVANQTTKVELKIIRTRDVE